MFRTQRIRKAALAASLAVASAATLSACSYIEQPTPPNVYYSLSAIRQLQRETDIVESSTNSIVSTTFFQTMIYADEMPSQLRRLGSEDISAYHDSQDTNVAIKNDVGSGRLLLQTQLYGTFVDPQQYQQDLNNNAGFLASRTSMNLANYYRISMMTAGVFDAYPKFSYTCNNINVIPFVYISPSNGFVLGEHDTAALGAALDSEKIATDRNGLPSGMAESAVVSHNTLYAETFLQNVGTLERLGNDTSLSNGKQRSILANAPENRASNIISQEALLRQVCRSSGSMTAAQEAAFSNHAVSQDEYDMGGIIERRYLRDAVYGVGMLVVAGVLVIGLGIAGLWVDEIKRIRSLKRDN